jgi:hypothetical protein
LVGIPFRPTTPANALEVPLTVFRLALQSVVLGHEFLFSFLVVGIGHTAIHGAYQCALGLIKMAHTLCAKFGINLEDLFPLSDGLVRAFRLAGSTQDALLGDHIGHGVHLLPLT